jgi:hypothetical protein
VGGEEAVARKLHTGGRSIYIALEEAQLLVKALRTPRTL